MKIILAENVANLGEIGEVKDVKEGFARNYLLPEGKAYPATDNDIKRVEKIKARYIERKGKELQKAVALAESIKGTEINLVRPVHEEKKLFGAVSTSEIAAALEEKGIVVDKKKIVIKDAIKEVGIYEVTVKIHPEAEAKLKIWVTPKE